MFFVLREVFSWSLAKAVSGITEVFVMQLQYAVSSCV